MQETLINLQFIHFFSVRRMSVRLCEATKAKDQQPKSKPLALPVV